MDIKSLLILFYISFGLSSFFVDGKTSCHYSKKSVVKFSKLDPTGDDEEGALMTGELLNDNTTELCRRGSDYCYALWQEDNANNQTTVVLLAQGCWDSSGEMDCGQNDCISKKRPPKALNNTKFCCCQGDNCNFNVTDAYVPFDEILIVEPAPQYVEDSSYKTEVVVVALACTSCLAIVAVASIFIFRLWSSSNRRHPDSMHLMEAPPPNSPHFDMESLTVQEMVGRGRFGSVCRGTIGEEHNVAVKVFVAQNRQYFLNERDIYTLPHMEHPCLPDYIGSDERVSTDGRPEYLLVISYAPLGCLQDYLRYNTIDWTSLCKIDLSITKGLSHLHTEIRKMDKTKPCIAHRDLNSRNVLVKADGTCELCDFGFAIRIAGSKYYQNGEEQIAETTSLADVGTLRYMAPEVLEGAVNLRDCETSLKQIDVYALGLCLWEVATRCSDLYQGMEVPTYAMPFEAEIGLHPSMEQMQVLVTRNKARPLFPDIWKASNPAIRLLKETIDDCWDQDAEARLTALCVEERLMELPLLWERYKTGGTVIGISPTFNANVTTYNIRPSFLGPTNQPIQPNLNGFIMLDSSDKNAGGYRSETDGIGSISESTADTILTASPSTDPFTQLNFDSNLKNNAHRNVVPIGFPKYSVPLQPHQGRNPTMERNLMTEEDLSISGNTLLERSEKDKDLRFLLSEEVFDLNLPRQTENIDVTRDAINPMGRTCNPIPYVQNEVHNVGNIPKQSNVPGNGKRKDITNTREEKKSFNPFSKNGIFSFLERHKNTKKNTNQDDKQPLKSSPTSENMPQQEATYFPREEDKSNLCNGVNFDSGAYQKLSPVITKVCVLGDNSHEEFVVARPTSVDEHLMEVCFDEKKTDLNENFPKTNQIDAIKSNLNSDRNSLGSTASSSSSSSGHHRRKANNDRYSLCYEQVGSVTNQVMKPSQSLPQNINLDETKEF